MNENPRGTQHSQTSVSKRFFIYYRFSSNNRLSEDAGTGPLREALSTTPPKINSDESLRIIIRAPDNIGNVNKSMAPVIKRDHKNNDIIFNII